MDNDLQKLKDFSQLLYEKNSKLRDIITNIEYLPKAKAVVGKYFKELKTYDSKRWYKYFYVYAIKGLDLKTVSFETNHNYHAQLIAQKETTYITRINGSYHTEITKQEYERARNKFLKKLNAIL